MKKFCIYLEHDWGFWGLDFSGFDIVILATLSLMLNDLLFTFDRF